MQGRGDTPFQGVEGHAQQRGSLEDEEKQIQAQNQKVLELTKENEGLKAEAKLAGTQVTALQSQIAAAYQEIGRANAAKDYAEQKVIKVQGKLSEARNKIKSLEEAQAKSSDFATKNGELDAAVAKMKEMAIKIAELEQEKTAAEGQFAAFRTQIAELEQEKTAVEELYKGESSKLQKKIVQLENELKNARPSFPLQLSLNDLSLSAENGTVFKDHYKFMKQTIVTACAASDKPQEVSSQINQAVMDKFSGHKVNVIVYESPSKTCYAWTWNSHKVSFNAKGVYFFFFIAS